MARTHSPIDPPRPSEPPLSQTSDNTSFGPRLRPDGTLFRLWAPHCESIRLKIDGRAESLIMGAEDGGWHELFVPGIGAGALYNFILPTGSECPDPASRFQPNDVHGPSEVMDPQSYRWNDAEWRGRPWEECVWYELHVGAFTPEGTFRAAAERLEDLAELGITAIGLMPIGDFSGDRNWGYDGVLPYAPDSSYGRPDDLKALIDAAHARGLMVFLDVVYNHFGPDGNYHSLYAPIFTEKHETPWGQAMNFDAIGSEFVREYIIQNAIHWIEEFHFDGLRLDAVHAMPDDSSPHVLEELAFRVRAAARGRKVHLVLENEENSASRLRRDASRHPAQYTAQWNDDIHHVLHAAASGESAAYYGEYAGNTEYLGRALAEGFAFQGQMMEFRGRARGEPSDALPPTAFVSFIQNHDQIGNRAFGDRITEFSSPEAFRAISAVYLLSPQIPMLFMGEEWATSQPFPFFCDFPTELGELVRKGRLNEFKHFPQFQDPAVVAKIPDPTAVETFRSAKLRWDDRRQGSHAEQLDWHRRVLAIRHAEIVPRLVGMTGHSSRYEILDDLAVLVRWRLADGAELTLVANLKDAPCPAPQPARGSILWREGGVNQGRLAPWSVIWTLAESENAG